jgi:hypothetical protein
VKNTVKLLNGKEYELILSTRALKEIAQKYGGLESFGDRILNSDSLTETLDDTVWLITTLINQKIMIDNLTLTDKKPLLTLEEVELLVDLQSLLDNRNAIIGAIASGTNRTILTEDNEKKHMAE